MAEREGFEPFCRLEVKSRAFADFVDFQFLETGNKKQGNTLEGREKLSFWQPGDNLGSTV
jgi:hypothetical protein